MNKNSAVEFAPESRIHISLAVTNVEASTAFYELLFEQPPTKTRDGYAKFEVHDPPVNLTLNRHSVGSAVTEGPQHYGIQVKSSSAVAKAALRFEQEGRGLRREDDVTCCHAVQDKVWVLDPDGHRWEVFVVTTADTVAHSLPDPKTEESPCCAPTCCQ